MNSRNTLLAVKWPLLVSLLALLFACGGGKMPVGDGSSSSSSASSSSSSSSSSSTSSSSSSGVITPVPNNLLSNGDVEAGIGPWEARGSAQISVNSAIKRSGNHSIFATGRSAAWHGAAYPIDYLTPGNTYQFSAWVQLANGEAATTAKISVEFQDASGARYPNVATANVSAGSWAYLSGSYTHAPTGNASDIKVYVEATNTTASFYLDDLAMTGAITAPPQPVSGDITIDTATAFQVIDGFGAALPMWSSSTWSDSETQKLVGMGDDALGLSIVRTIIRPNRNDWGIHVSALQAAEQYGDNVTILASPWTPPAQWKDNNSLIDGGKLLPEYYDDYAYHLNDFVAFMNDRGIQIDVTSIQNEPNWHPSYESCDWSGEEFRVFLRDHGNKIQNTKLMVAETIGFQREYTDPVLNDSAASDAIAYIGGHLYGPWNTTTHAPNSRLTRYPLAAQRGKPVWMTEWNYHAADNVNGSEPSGGSTSPWADATNAAVWNETLDDVLASVHYSLSSDWSAYIWWWGRRYYSFIGESRNEAWVNTPSGQILKRGWAFSQYARYVRPGYVRVAASKSGTVANRDGLLVTAYQGSDNKLVLVMVNKETANLDNVTIGLPVVPTAAEFTFTSRYSARADRAITLNGQRATVSIPARSVATVVIEY